jgi:D-glycero-D-manno-heptose 1,7-bisphosphate phosphatase
MDFVLPENQIFWWQSPTAEGRRPCLFLDRDGVVVVEVDYLHRPADVRLERGVGRLIRFARAQGLAVGIVSNQSGIGRSLFGWEAFAAVQAEILRQLDLGPAPFDFVAACGTHPNAVRQPMQVIDHPWRKPAPGMLRMAAEALDLDLPRSILIGDNLTDLEAGRRAGIGRLAHVASGHGRLHRPAVSGLAEELGAGGLLLLDDLTQAPRAFGWTRDGEDG